MTLTFKSTVSEYVRIIIGDSDGSRRVATLQRDPTNHRKWTGSIDHPSGERWPVATFDFDPATALGSLSQAVVSRECDYAQSKGRGHRREPQRRDDNRSVDSMPAPITGTYRS
jgi:hypothetical protein